MPIDKWRKVQFNYYNSTLPFDLVIRREIFYEIYGLLLEHTKNVWVTSGTLLGAIRDNNFDLNLIEKDLTYVLFDNESNKSTGGPDTFQDHIDYNKIVEYCNFNP